MMSSASRRVPLVGAILAMVVGCGSLREVGTPSVQSETAELPARPDSPASQPTPSQLEDDQMRAAGSPGSDDPVTAGRTAHADASDVPSRDGPDHPLPSADGTFNVSIEPLADEVRSRIVGTSWRDGCPVDLADLRYVRLTHRTFEGRTAIGELVLHADAAESAVEIFRDWFHMGFAIERMQLVDDFGGDDDRSMAANNTSGFNCRTVAGTSRWSEHAFGRAIDVNPVQNPYVTDGRVSPPAGTDYVDRSRVRIGMLIDGSPEVEAIYDHGWGWGGHWSSSSDYQHLSTTGR